MSLDNCTLNLLFSVVRIIGNCSTTNCMSIWILSLQLSVHTHLCMLQYFLLLFFSEMGEYRRSEAGQGGSAETFYKTTLEPADWWKWFKNDYKAKEGWTEVLHY